MKRALASLLLALTVAPTASATCMIPFASLSMPSTRVNTRVTANLWQIRRPALSFNGLDNTAAGLNTAYGRGLKQGLMAAFGTPTGMREPNDRILYSRFVSRLPASSVGSVDALFANPGFYWQLSGQWEANGSDKAVQDSLVLNAKRLEALAFFALTSAVVQANGHSLADLSACHDAVGAALPKWA